MSAIILLFTPTSCHTIINIAMYGAVIYISQFGIDTFGHTWVSYHGKRFPKRNKLHSLIGIIGWGFVFGIPFLLSCPLFTFAVVIGMIIHYFEDFLTEGGVYFGKRRIRTPLWIDYDNKIANKVTILSFLIPVLFLFSSNLSTLFKEPIVFIYYISIIFFSVIAFFGV